MDIKQVDSRLWPFGNETKVFIPEDDCLYIRSDYTPAEYEKPSPQAEPISIDHPSLRPTPPIISILDYKPSDYQKKFEIHSASDFMMLKSIYTQKY
jgi:hypothetical protein